MNWLDLGLILLLVISMVSGIREGFSRSGFGFLAVLLAFLSAAWLYPTNAKGFIIVFVGLIAAAGVGAFLIGRWLKKVGMTSFDRLVGGALGLTNAVLIAVLALVGIMAFAPKSIRDYVAGSRAVPYALRAAWTVAQVVPDEMKFRVEDSYAELIQVLPPKFRKPMRRPRPDVI